MGDYVTQGGGVMNIGDHQVWISWLRDVAWVFEEENQ